MATSDNSKSLNDKRIIVSEDGPYLVRGGVPLVRKKQVVSENGEPLTWQKEADLTTSTGEYALCRCGQSECMPFCDGSHRIVGFEGTETAPTNQFAERAIEVTGATRIVVRKDPTLCMDSGFCGMREAGLDEFVAGTADPKIRSLVIAMIERCPSGALTYRFEPAGPDVEPDLPPQIADTTEVLSSGPIAGPLWVSGNIPVERADGQPFETRNRVTLCNCGLSHIKPLCDGTHRHEIHRGARKRR